MSTTSTELSPLVSQRLRLPIHEFKGIFLDAFAASQCILINTTTGSGTSTQIPQWSVELTKSSGKLVASAQPRRLCAVSLAVRVAEEMDVELGMEVGFAIRHEERGGSVLKYCTDGWLLREMEKDPLLNDYGIIIVDGVHERTLHIDVLIGKLKTLLNQRKELKIVVIGEDIDTHKFMIYFNHHYLISTLSLVESPPTIVHAPHQCLTPVESVIETVVGLQEKEGNILILLATQDEVEKTCKEIGRRTEGLVCIPLHPGVSLEELSRASSIQGRKCIVSTASGESSAVIFDDITIVIDGGFCETDFYDQVESKQVILISKATADRRAARVGVKKVVRVYSKDVYEKMEKDHLPVILRANPKRVREVLKENGIEMDTIDLIDKPATSVTSSN